MTAAGRQGRHAATSNRRVLPVERALQRRSAEQLDSVAVQMDDDLFSAFDEAPRRLSSGGLVAQLRDENAALRKQLAQLRDVGSMPELLRTVCEPRREAICTVTFHPQASLELRHTLERVLRSARATVTPTAADADAAAPDTNGELIPAPSAAAHVPEPAHEVHFLQAYCWDTAGEASGWAALQHPSPIYHRPLPLLEGDTIVFSAHATGDARGRRGGRRGGGNGDGRRYWELELGPDPDSPALPAESLGGEPPAPAAQPPRPGVLSRATMDALGMSATRCEPPPYLGQMRIVGYPPAYELAPSAAVGAGGAAAAEDGPDGDDDGALLFYDAAVGAGRRRREGNGSFAREAPGAAASDKAAAGAPAAAAEAADAVAEPGAAAACAEELQAAGPMAAAGQVTGEQDRGRGTLPASVDGDAEEGELSDDEMGAKAEAGEERARGSEGDAKAPRAGCLPAPNYAYPCPPQHSPLPLPGRPPTEPTPPNLDAPRAAATGGARQRYLYPGLNAPPPDGADPRAWSSLYAVQASAQHAPPGPLRGGAACRPHALAAGPPLGQVAPPSHPHWAATPQHVPLPSCPYSPHPPGYPPACPQSYLMSACPQSPYLTAAGCLGGHAYPQPPPLPPGCGYAASLYGQNCCDQQQLAQSVAASFGAGVSSGHPSQSSNRPNTAARHAALYRPY